MQLKSRSAFVALVILAIVVRGFALGNIYAALGASLIEIPVGILLGRLILWFIDQVSLFVLNYRNPENRKQKIDRSLWKALSLSLVIGVPLFALISYVPK